MLFHTIDLLIANSWLEYQKHCVTLRVSKKNILDLLHFKMRLASDMCMVGLAKKQKQRGDHHYRLCKIKGYAKEWLKFGLSMTVWIICQNLMINAKQPDVKITVAVVKAISTAINVQCIYASLWGEIGFIFM